MGDKTTWEPRKATTPTNTHPHMKGDKRRQAISEAKKATTPTNTHPTQRETTKDNGRQDNLRAHPTWRETTGDNRRQDHFRGQEGYHTNQHLSPHEGRQPETTGDKTTSEAKMAATPTNTHPTWRETTGENGRQRETRPLQSPRSRPHQPTPTPHMKGDNWRQWETTGDKTTSEPKKPTTPTNTKAARSKVALRTPTVNCLGKNENSPEASTPELLCTSIPSILRQYPTKTERNL